MADGGPVPGSVYFYAPNKAAAICFAAAFATTGLLHLWQCIYYKCFKTTALLPAGCALLTAAYITRAYGAFHYDDAQVYTASTLLVYLSPPIFQLANLSILGRVFHFVPYFAPMHPARMMLTFACLAGATELLTATGISFLANREIPEKSIKLGDSLTKASLVVQIIVISVFFLLLVTFHYCCRAGSIGSPKVVRPLLALYTSMLLILGRTIYRLVEHSTVPVLVLANPPQIDPSNVSPAARSERYFYVFDGGLMLLNVILWHVWHPRMYLPEKDTTYLAQDGATELKGPGWKDSGSLMQTFLDPFAALTNRGGHQKPFWERNGYTLKRRRRRRAATRG